MWVGKSENKQAKLFGMKWANVTHCLGIYIGHDKFLDKKFELTR